MSGTPKTTAEALRDLADAFVTFYIEYSWPYWDWWMRLIGRVPDRAEFEQAIRAYYLGVPSAKGDQESIDADVTGGAA